MPTLKPLPRGLQLWNDKRSTPVPPGTQTVVANPLFGATWAKLQPVEGGPINFPLIDAGIDYAKANGIRYVLLRIEAGIHCPQWVYDEVGSFPFRERDMAERGLPPAPCARFWEPAFWRLFDDFSRQLAAHYEPIPEVVGLYSFLPMCRYDEPCIRGIAFPEVRDGFKAAGYTLQADLAAHREAWAIHRRWWPTTRLLTSYNPFQDPSASNWAGRSSAATSIKLMQDAVAFLGHQAVTQNNSLRQSWLAFDAGNATRVMYDGMIALGKAGYPIGWQSAGMDLVGDRKVVFDWAAEQGAILMESRHSDLDPGYCKTISAKLAGNVLRYPTPEERVGQLTQDVANKTQLLAAYDAEKVRLERELAELRANFTALVDENEELERLNNLADVARDDALEKVSGLQQQVTVLQQGQDALIENYAAAQQRIALLSERIEQARAALAEA